MSPRARRQRKDDQDARTPGEIGLQEPKSEETQELTGADAAPDEAEYGSAGNGADPFEADLSGAKPWLEAVEPGSEGQDVAPDRVDRYKELERQAGAEEDEEEEDEDREITARPSEHSEPDFSQLP
ncbi:MAG: hypothetical protein ACJ790_01600 [Myxococcaceae bacterium]